MSDRQELIRNAVIFLQDPKTQQSSLAQRIQFLEAKGLTPVEIDVAIKQSSPYPMVVSPYRWDWRDYFITAVVSGTIAYGASALFRKYVVPHLQVPTSSAYESDRDGLTAQFDAAEALLKEIQGETTAVREAVEEQKERVEQTTERVEAAVKEMREGETKTRDEMREIREEIENVRDMLPKMIEKNKESQTQTLGELQQELRSLKALLLNRGGSSLPGLSGKASIPGWQLSPHVVEADMP